MKQTDLEKKFIASKTDKLSFTGTCHDCRIETIVLADWTEKGISITGGAVYQPTDADGDIFVKCESCYNKDAILRNYRITDVYSRVVGYLRPVNAWNGSKQQEFRTRKNYKVLEQANF